MSRLSYAQRAHQYARDVVDGRRVECEWIRLACERHLLELERKDWRWTFNAEKADDFCSFIEGLPHVKGRWNTDTIVLEPWQIFFVGSIFGWLDVETKWRRFRKALLVVGRGNAKTTTAAAIALAVMCLDHEPGAQIYSGAKTRDQAKIVWQDAWNMADRTAGMRDAFGLRNTAHAITLPREGTTFQALSRDAKVAEGHSIHCGIVDEVHAHPDRQIYDVMLHGMRARKQPLLIEISTEGDDDSGILAEETDYLHDILRGTVEGERFFGMHFTLDKEDDWTSPQAWRKANPNLGVSVFVDELEVLRDQALANPGAQGSFKTKRCNIKVGAIDGYFNTFAWDNLCKADILEDDFISCPCWHGVDLASESDIASHIRLYRSGSKYAVFGTHYLPGDCIVTAGANRDRYRGWASGKRPALMLTEGNSTDFDRLERDILESARATSARVVAFDPTQATMLVQHLESFGITCIKVPQSAAHLSEPMKRIGSEIQGGKLLHNGDPILSWAIGNVIAKVNERDEVVPRRPHPAKKIDPAAALIIAKSRAITEPVVVNPYADPREAVV